MYILNTKGLQSNCFKSCGFFYELVDVFRNSADLCSRLSLTNISGNVNINLSLPYESREKCIGYNEALGKDPLLTVYQSLSILLFLQRIIIFHPDGVPH